MTLKLLSKKSDGFTLLEVLIAMAVLVFISFAIYQATIETYKLRDSLSTEGDFYNGIRLSTTILQRDISLMYSPLIALPEKKPGVPADGSKLDSVNGSALPTGSENLAQSSKFWSPAVDETGIRPSHFIGTDTKLSFISLSHVRIYKDSPESEFSKITYETKPDANDKNSSSLVLVKTESPNVFSMEDNRDPSSHSFEILKGIKKLSFSYSKRDGNTWKTSRSWDSEKEDPINTYPDMIELTIEIIGPQKQTFEGTFKFRPEIPLNGLNPSL